MKPKRTSWVMLICIIMLVIAVHNTLRSEVNGPDRMVTRKMHLHDTTPSYFAASFLRVTE